MKEKVMLTLVEEEFRQEYSSYKRLLEILRNQEERMQQTCLRLGQIAVREGLWHDLRELPLTEGKIAQVTLVRKDESLHFAKGPAMPGEIYEKEKDLSKGFLFLVTM